MLTKLRCDFHYWYIIDFSKPHHINFFMAIL
jgi:hypothetical protein